MVKKKARDRPLSLVYKLLNWFPLAFDMVLRTYSWIVASKQRDRLLTEAMNKPRTPLEMQNFLGLGKNNKLTPAIHQMVGRGVLKALAKGVYGLPKHGQQLRKKRLKELGQPYSYAEEPGVDWNGYAWVLKGSNRVKLIKVMEPKPTKAADLIRRAKKIGPVTNRAFYVLRDFVRKELAVAIKHTPQVSYGLNRKGESIKHQLLKVWLMLFVCL